MKRIVALALILVTLSTCMTIPAFAALEGFPKQESGNVFNSSWEYPWDYDSGRGTLYYGYDNGVLGIGKKDTVKVFHNTRKHYGSVGQGGSWGYTNDAEAKVMTNKASVAHMNGTITWMATLY